MSYSVTLRKTYGTIFMIASFVLLALATCCIGIPIHFFSIDIFLHCFIPLVFSLSGFFATSMGISDCFIEAGKHLEKEKGNENRKKGSVPSDDDDDSYEYVEQEFTAEELLDIDSIQDAVKLKKTYAILCLIAAFLLFAVVILIDILLFLANFALIFLLFPELFVAVFIYAFAASSTEYFMEAGMYMEKGEKLMEV